MAIFEKYIKRISLVSLFLLFLLLLFKNPFSERNLIPNLEPFPDTIHYLNPPLSLLRGETFSLERGGIRLKPSVPFLYSASLIPGFLIYQDVRIFYFTNVLLAFIGLFFFYKSLEKLFANSYITFTVLFFYISNYFIFWFPNLAMAENLLLALFNIGIFLLFSKRSVKNAFLVGLVGISFYATKYASISLSAAYLFCYFLGDFIQLIIEIKESGLKSLLKKPKKLFHKKSFLIITTFILSSGLSLLLFFAVDFFMRGNNIFVQIFQLAAPLTKSASEATSASRATNWFDQSFFKEHFFIYLNSITGNPMRFLWDQTPILPKYIALPAIAGIILGFFTKNYRYLSFTLTLLVLIPILAIASFYTTDARYIYHAIPTLLIGFGLFLKLIYILISKIGQKKVFYFLLITLTVFYALTNFYRLKYQIALNLRHAETPWYYLSVKNFNGYFQGQSLVDKPILITAMQPYYIDFFSNSTYQLLPLSKDQDFFPHVKYVWGPNDYSDLIMLYKKYLNENRRLYVTNAALGNEGYLHKSFDLVKQEFTLTEVAKGCFDTCNIYRIANKK